MTPGLWVLAAGVGWLGAAVVGGLVLGRVLRRADGCCPHPDAGDPLFLAAGWPGEEVAGRQVYPRAVR